MNVELIKSNRVYLKVKQVPDWNRSQ